MSTMLIFGLGYSAQFIADALAERGWDILSTGSKGMMVFDDAASVSLALDRATHILSSVPPVVDGDPVLERYGALIRAKRCWTGYLSSTGVYGDCDGAWVDETAPIKGRRESRNQADRDWQALGAHVFRLPGIYGPGRSMLERARAGQAHRIEVPEQVFSRVHVCDITSGVIAALHAPAGVYNLADDAPSSQNRVVEETCRLLGISPPPMRSLEESNLSPAALAFYAENRRVANSKAKRVLGWEPRYPDYRAGLAELAMNFSESSSVLVNRTPSRN